LARTTHRASAQLSRLRVARLWDVYHVLRSVVIRFIRFEDSPRRGRGPETEERKKLCVLSVSAVHPYSDYIAEALRAQAIAPMRPTERRKMLSVSDLLLKRASGCMVLSRLERATSLGRAVVDVASMNAIKFIYISENFGYGGLRQLLGPERSSKT